MTSLVLVSLLTLPVSIFGFDTGHLEHNGITVNFNTEECELEILYLDIQFICHSKDRPAFFIGRGEFDAVYYTGNYEINDTVTQWVWIFFLGWIQNIYCFQVPFLDFEFELPTIKLKNVDVDVGMNLDIEEHYDEGKFTLKFSFPEEYYPEVQNYNR